MFPAGGRKIFFYIEFVPKFPTHIFFHEFSSKKKYSPKIFLQTIFPPKYSLSLLGTEVMEVSQALDGRRYDADELEDEQRERQMRQRLNTEFQNFVKRVEEASGLEFDIPYRDLGFYGVPHRSSVFLQPTVHCLVNLTETPFFVLSLDDLEIAYFERVQVTNGGNFAEISVFVEKF